MDDTKISMSKEAMSYEALDMAPFCCIVLNHRNEVVHANKRACNTFGSDKLTGLSIDNFSPKYQPGGLLSQDAIRKHLGTAWREGDVKFYWEATGLDGNLLPHPFEVICMPIDFGKETCLSVYYRELSEICVGCPAMREKRAAEGKLERLIENMPIACHTFDKEHNIVDCNSAAAELFGAPDTEYLLQNHDKIIPQFQPDGRLSKEKAKELIAKAFDEGIANFQWMDQKLDGELLPVDITLVRIESAGKYYVVSFIIDMRKHYNFKSKEYSAVARLSAMLDSLPLVCTIFDENDNILEVNASAEKVFEIPDKQIYIDNFFAFSPSHQPDGKTSKEKAAEMLTAARMCGSVSFNWTHQTRDGKLIPAEVCLKQAFFEGRNHVISYTTDLRP